MSAPDGLPVACAACTGVPAYRTRFEGFPDAADNFDQVSDHQPRVFTSPQWLEQCKAYRTGRVTVWQLADNEHDRDVVIAYAGPDPHRAGQRAWYTDVGRNGNLTDLLKTGATS